MNVDDVLVRALSNGAVVDGVVVGQVPDVVPDSDSHRWICFPTSGGGLVIGGMDRSAPAIRPSARGFAGRGRMSPAYAVRPDHSGGTA